MDRKGSMFNHARESREAGRKSVHLVLSFFRSSLSSLSVSLLFTLSLKLLPSNVPFLSFFPFIPLSILLPFVVPCALCSLFSCSLFLIGEDSGDLFATTATGAPSQNRETLRTWKNYPTFQLRQKQYQQQLQEIRPTELVRNCCLSLASFFFFLIVLCEFLSWHFFFFLFCFSLLSQQIQSTQLVRDFCCCIFECFFCLVFLCSFISLLFLLFGLCHLFSPSPPPPLTCNFRSICLSFYS